MSQPREACPPDVLEWIPWYPDQGLNDRQRGTVEAHAAGCADCREEISLVLGKATVTATSDTGEFRFAALPPGDYKLTFTLPGFATEERNLTVYLQQKAVIEVALRTAEFEGEIVVTSETPVIDPTSAELKTAITDEVIEMGHPWPASTWLIR